MPAPPARTAAEDAQLVERLHDDGLVEFAGESHEGGPPRRNYRLTARGSEALARDGEPDRLVVPAVVLPDGSRQDVAQHEPGTLPLVAAALVPPAVLPRRLRTALDPWRAAARGRSGSRWRSCSSPVSPTRPR